MGELTDVAFKRQLSEYRTFFTVVLESLHVPAPNLAFLLYKGRGQIMP